MPKTRSLRRRRVLRFIDSEAEASDRDNSDADEAVTDQDDNRDEDFVDDSVLQGFNDLRLQPREREQQDAQKKTEKQQRKERMSKVRQAKASKAAEPRVHAAAAEEETMVVPPTNNKSPKKKKICNWEKVGNADYHAEESQWSMSFVRVRGDVDREATITCFKEWMKERSSGEGCGFLERGEQGNLHLQGWFSSYCDTEQSGRSAMTLCFKKHFGVENDKGYKVCVKPFERRQNKTYMTGYGAKDWTPLQVNGTDFHVMGDRFEEGELNDIIQKCRVTYFAACPKTHTDRKVQFNKSNLITYAYNYKTRYLDQLKPVPSLGRIVTWMIQEGGYTPAANFLSSGYPLDRVRMETMWQIINDPKAAKKSDVCEFIFSNNEGMLKPFELSVEPGECNHPFGRNGRDCEGSDYEDIDVDDAKAFCSEVRCGSSEHPSDFGNAGRPATHERADIA